MDKQSRLKVYFGPNDRLQVNEASPQSQRNDQHIVVKLAEILDPLTDAIETDRTWLNDFREDEVTISRDLHDVLKAYKKLKRSA